jgi:hypothetical protein
MNGLVAATSVMTLGTYPLVYLPVAAAATGGHGA